MKWTHWGLQDGATVPLTILAPCWPELCPEVWYG